MWFDLKEVVRERMRSSTGMDIEVEQRVETKQRQALAGSLSHVITFPSQVVISGGGTITNVSKIFHFNFNLVATAVHFNSQWYLSWFVWILH